MNKNNSRSYNNRSNKNRFSRETSPVGSQSGSYQRNQHRNGRDWGNRSEQDYQDDFRRGSPNGSNNTHRSDSIDRSQSYHSHNRNGARDVSRDGSDRNSFSRTNSPVDSQRGSRQPNPYRNDYDWNNRSECDYQDVRRRASPDGRNNDYKINSRDRGDSYHSNNQNSSRNFSREDDRDNEWDNRPQNYQRNGHREQNRNFSNGGNDRGDQRNRSYNHQQRDGRRFNNRNGYNDRRSCSPQGYNRDDDREYDRNHGYDNYQNSEHHYEENGSESGRSDYSKRFQRRENDWDRGSNNRDYCQSDNFDNGRNRYDDYDHRDQRNEQYDRDSDRRDFSNHGGNCYNGEDRFDESPHRHNHQDHHWNGNHSHHDPRDDSRPQSRNSSRLDGNDGARRNNNGRRENYGNSSCQSEPDRRDHHHLPDFRNHPANRKWQKNELSSTSNGQKDVPSTSSPEKSRNRQESNPIRLNEGLFNQTQEKCNSRNGQGSSNANRQNEELSNQPQENHDSRNRQESSNCVIGDTDEEDDAEEYCAMLDNYYETHARRKKNFQHYVELCKRNDEKRYGFVYSDSESGSESRRDIDEEELERGYEEQKKWREDEEERKREVARQKLNEQNRALQYAGERYRRKMIERLDYSVPVWAIGRSFECERHKMLSNPEPEKPSKEQLERLDAFVAENRDEFARVWGTIQVEEMVYVGRPAY